MATGDLVAAYAADDGTEFRVFQLSDEPPAFSAWVNLPANREDEWGMLAIAALIDASPEDVDRALEAFNGWTMELWERDDNDQAYQLRRNIVAGVTLDRVANAPTAISLAIDARYRAWKPATKKFLAEAPVELCRVLRDEVDDLLGEGGLNG